MLTLILAFPSGSAGAIPSAFNVQGRLTDSQGVNRDGSFPIKFTLFDAPTGGNAVWARTFSGSNAITVRNGNFQVALGDPADAPSQTLAGALSDASRFLEIQVLGEAPMVPRQQLLSVPFALRAGTVAQAPQAPLAFGWVEVPEVSFTNQSFTGAPCLAAVTLTTGANPVRVEYSGSFRNSSAGPSVALSITQDGAFVPPWDQDHGIAYMISPAASYDLNGSFSVTLPTVSAGAHAWCLTGDVSTAVGSITNRAGGNKSRFSVVEVR